MERIALPLVWTGGALGTLAFVRPFGRRVAAFGVTVAVLLGWWSTIRPSNERA